MHMAFLINCVPMMERTNVSPRGRGSVEAGESHRPGCERGAMGLLPRVSMSKFDTRALARSHSQGSRPAGGSQTIRPRAPSRPSTRASPITLGERGTDISYEVVCPVRGAGHPSQPTQALAHAAGIINHSPETKSQLDHVRPAPQQRHLHFSHPAAAARWPLLGLTQAAACWAPRPLAPQHRCPMQERFHAAIPERAAGVREAAVVRTVGRPAFSAGGKPRAHAYKPRRLPRHWHFHRSATSVLRAS